MKGKVFLAVVVLMCLAVVTQPAMAQPQGRGPREGRGPGQGGPGRGGMMGRGGGMFEGLDLTEEQQAKIAKIREEIMEKATNADSPEARREIFGQMREKIQGVLTPEQREKMTQRFSGRRGREGDRPQRPGGPGQRPGQDASRTRSMGPIQVLDALVRRLGLNEEQKKKIAKIRKDAIKKLFDDVKAVLTAEQKTRFEQAQKRLREAQQRRPGAGGPPREGGSRRGRGDRERGSRRGGGGREGGPRDRARSEDGGNHKD